MIREGLEPKSPIRGLLPYGAQIVAIETRPIATAHNVKTVCAICGLGPSSDRQNPTVSCNGVDCSNSYHLRCVPGRKPLKEIPKGNWFCPPCVATTATTQPTSKQMKSGRSNSLSAATNYQTGCKAADAMAATVQDDDGDGNGGGTKQEQKGALPQLHKEEEEEQEEQRYRVRFKWRGRDDNWLATHTATPAERSSTVQSPPGASGRYQRVLEKTETEAEKRARYVALTATRDS